MAPEAKAKGKAKAKAKGAPKARGKAKAAPAPMVRARAGILRRGAGSGGGLLKRPASRRRRAEPGGQARRNNDRQSGWHGRSPCRWRDSTGRSQLLSQSVQSRRDHHGAGFRGRSPGADFAFTSAQTVAAKSWWRRTSCMR